MVKNTFLNNIIFLIQMCISTLFSMLEFRFLTILDKDRMNMSFHGNETLVEILLLKTFHQHSKLNNWESFKHDY